MYRPFPHPKYLCAGFTLLELMVTISILAILLGIAVPSFQDSTRRGEISSQAGAVTSAVNIAKSEAIKRAQNVSICPKKDNACSGDTDWSTGWIVFTDNSGFTGDFDGTDVVLQSSQEPPAGMTVTTRAMDSADKEISEVSSITFTSTGELTNFPGGMTYLQVQVSKSGCGDNEMRQISVRSNGRIAVSRTDCT